LKQLSAKVISNQQILPPFTHPGGRATSGSNIIWLGCPEIAKQARPGQFVMVRCGDKLTLPRPFSIHQVSDEGIALFYAVWTDGKGTTWLSQRQTEDTIDIFGPLGNGFHILPDSHNLLLVAGGTGIAPLYFMAQQALSEGHAVTLLLGAQTKAQLYPESLIPPEVKLIATTDDSSTTRKGRVTSLLPDFADPADQIFACGPAAMYRDMADSYYQLLKDKPVQISLEIMMGCGLGVCYGCTIRTRGGLKQVCKDGPVFDLEDIRWDELKSQGGML